MGRLKRQNPLAKHARRGHRGYPVATVAYYGPDDKRASKVAVGILPHEGSDVTMMERWHSDLSDVRFDRAISKAVLDFIRSHGVRSVVMADRIIGCPHEEGVDYPEGEACPKCPFWAIRDRWSGETIQ
jgi:hypothetical protein